MTSGWVLRDGGVVVGRLKWSQFGGWHVVASRGYLVDDRRTKRLGSLSLTQHFSIVAADEEVSPPSQKTPKATRTRKTKTEAPRPRQSDWGDSFGESS